MQMLRKHYGSVGAALLLLVLLCELTLSVRQQSLTYDESCHLFAGYLFWEKPDFGVNPEHPPLVKALAAIPLLSMHLKLPPARRLTAYFKAEGYFDGRDFIFGNGGGAGADRIIFRARMAAASLSLLLGLLVFLAAREMFGTGAALIALTLLVFEPNIVAHGAYVTTDMGIACFMFASIYALYRYVKAPSWTRMIAMGLAAGLALASKHSAVLLLPMAAALIGTEMVRGDRATHPANQVTRKSAKWLVGGLVVASLIGYGVLWGFYGFHYSARPEGLQMNPPLAEYVRGLKSSEAGLFLGLARWHILPESYLYGLADMRLAAASYPTYLLGKIYAHGVWFYFPAAFIIKSTAAFMALIVLSGFAIGRGKLQGRREILFLTIPPVLYLLFASTNGLNIGARHILPMYAFLAVLIGGAVVALANGRRHWVYITGVLLLWHVVSASRSYPDYLAYSNEIWGGSANTYKYLSDSNTDWAQELKAVKNYLDERAIKDCWFAYLAEPAIEFRAYGIPCKQLPTVNIGGMDVPATIHGTVLISASTLAGFEFGSNILNPYRQFQQLRPVNFIKHGVFVYDGELNMRLVSALGHVDRATALATSNQLGPALAEAQIAVQLDPDGLQAQMILGDLQAALGHPLEARRAYQQALTAAEAMEPDAAAEWVPQIQRKLGGV